MTYSKDDVKNIIIEVEDVLDFFDRNANVENVKKEKLIKKAFTLCNKVGKNASEKNISDLTNFVNKILDDANLSY